MVLQVMQLHCRQCQQTPTNTNMQKPIKQPANQTTNQQTNKIWGCFIEMVDFSSKSSRMQRSAWALRFLVWLPGQNNTSDGKWLDRYNQRSTPASSESEWALGSVLPRAVQKDLSKRKHISPALLSKSRVLFMTWDAQTLYAEERI